MVSPDQLSYLCRHTSHAERETGIFLYICTFPPSVLIDTRASAHMCTEAQMNGAAHKHRNRKHVHAWTPWLPTGKLVGLQRPLSKIIV